MTFDAPALASVVGSPEQCREQLLSFAERHGVDEIAFCAVGGTRQDRIRVCHLLAEALELRP